MGQATNENEPNTIVERAIAVLDVHKDYYWGSCPFAREALIRDERKA